MSLSDAKQAHLARLAAIRTPAKAAASRANAKLGGRKARCVICKGPMRYLGVVADESGRQFASYRCDTCRLTQDRRNWYRSSRDGTVTRPQDPHGTVTRPPE